ncbi:MAG: hypothetical protein NTX89_02345 [Candidatus Omnitrophica bacterium]|nr:hypothetical protein [Candidatus Omnitrophota bacterium]
MNKRSIILVLIIYICFSGSSFAETILLKSGRTVEGKLIKKTDEYIKIDFQGMPLTYYLEDIESIDGEKVILDNKQENISVPAVPYTEFKMITMEGNGYLKDKNNNSIIHFKSGKEEEAKIVRRVKDNIYLEMSPGVDAGISIDNIDCIETTVANILTNTYVNEKYGIFFQGPKDWVMVTPDGYYEETRKWESNQLVYFYKYPIEETSLRLANKDYSAIGIYLDELANNETVLGHIHERYRLLKANAFPDLQIIKEPVEINSNGTKWIKSIVDTQGFKTIDYFLLKNRILYVISCISFSKDFETNSSIFEKVITSFELK